MDKDKLVDALSHLGIGCKTRLEELIRISNEAEKFPIFNLLKRKDGDVCIEIALAGYCVEDIIVESTSDRIIVRSDGREAEENADQLYYCAHRGIAARHFERVFPVAGKFAIKDVSFINGILRIDVDRHFDKDTPTPHNIRVV